ncbi:hypothetical protein CPC08DRAFT_524086 [Agrocybe pediades]|nr:hypothetical protein CPC08DRAFT_524086 [Agrocybe pediades]
MILNELLHLILQELIEAQNTVLVWLCSKCCCCCTAHRCIKLAKNPLSAAIELLRCYSESLIQLSNLLDTFREILENSILNSNGNSFSREEFEIIGRNFLNQMILSAQQAAPQGPPQEQMNHDRNIPPRIDGTIYGHRHMPTMPHSSSHTSSGGPHLHPYPCPNISNAALPASLPAYDYAHIFRSLFSHPGNFPRPQTQRAASHFDGPPPPHPAGDSYGQRLPESQQRSFPVGTTFSASQERGERCRCCRRRGDEDGKGGGD